MDRDDYYNFRKLQRTGACTFIPYDGLLTPDVIARYLEKHGQDFDAVAVLNGEPYADVRQTLEAHFQGPKILLGGKVIAAPTPYVASVPNPVRLSGFERVVREAFAALR